MIRIENTEIVGWEPAIRGMRNPMNSWEKSDSKICEGITECIMYCEGKDCPGYKKGFTIGPNDQELMNKLAAGGPVHAKYRRMIVVYLDIIAPLYWWKEFDTYKVGAVSNSCSTMHKIQEKEFTLEDFSCENLISNCDEVYILDVEGCCPLSPRYLFKEYVLNMLNNCRTKYLETKNKKYWWQMIQLLPSSYNQRRTVMLNYEVLAGIYPMRKNHKLDEWKDFCKWIESLPYYEIITGNQKESE